MLASGVLHWDIRIPSPCQDVLGVGRWKLTTALNCRGTERLDRSSITAPSFARPLRPMGVERLPKECSPHVPQRKAREAGQIPLPKL